MNDDEDFVFTNSNVPSQIPTILYVTDICRIVGRSGMNDDEDFVFTNSNVPLQIPTFL